jgi:hypothetical protein
MWYLTDVTAVSGYVRGGRSDTYHDKHKTVDIYIMKMKKIIGDCLARGKDRHLRVLVKPSAGFFGECEA